MLSFDTRSGQSMLPAVSAQVLKRSNKVSITGGTPVTLASGFPAPEVSLIAVDGSHAYWTSRAGGTLMRVGTARDHP